MAENIVNSLAISADDLIWLYETTDSVDITGLVNDPIGFPAKHKIAIDVAAKRPGATVVFNYFGPPLDANNVAQTTVMQGIQGSSLITVRPATPIAQRMEDILWQSYVNLSTLLPTHDATLTKGILHEAARLLGIDDTAARAARAKRAKPLAIDSESNAALFAELKDFLTSPDFSDTVLSDRARMTLTESLSNHLTAVDIPKVQFTLLAAEQIGYLHLHLGDDDLTRKLMLDAIIQGGTLLKDYVNGAEQNAMQFENADDAQKATQAVKMGTEIPSGIKTTNPKVKISLSKTLRFIYDYSPPAEPRDGDGPTPGGGACGKGSGSAMPCPDDPSTMCVEVDNVWVTAY